MGDTKLLDYYSNNFTVDQLSSEDILKLMDNYIRVEIAEAFHISREEFDKIRKKKGASNRHVENAIRDIAVLLNYIDTKEKSIGNEVRNGIITILITSMNQLIPHRDFYLKTILQIDFSKENIKKLIDIKGIDVQYRLAKMEFLISALDEVVENLLTHPDITTMLNNQLETLSIKYITQDIDSSENEITINIDGEDETYYVTYSDEKYSVNPKKGNRKYNGAKHNYKLENEEKQKHGMLGEKIALEAEKKRLIKIGLEDLVEEVLLVAQIDEETTFDGLGYDLLSFNENRERICIEVKTSYGKKDKPFFISKKELELIQGIKEEHGCKQILIQYLLIDGKNITIKNIYPYDFDTLRLTPILYKVDS